MIDTADRCWPKVAALFRSCLGPVAVLLLSLPSEAFAHAFPRPYDLPLPLGHWLIGAGIAVALSFVGAAGLMRGRGASREKVVALPRRATNGLLVLLQSSSVAIFSLLLLAGFVGDQSDWDRNILPVAVWVVWWVGMAFVCALGGNLWVLVNPWAILGRLAFGQGGPALRLPERAGVWPAVVLFLLFAWTELVWPSNAVPARLACAILLYSLVTFAAMALFGVKEWLRRGEVFAILFDLFSRFAPLDGRRDAAGHPHLVLRSYGAGLATSPPPSTSMTALVIAILAAVSFDGFSETPAWARLSGDGVGLLYRLGVVGILGYVAAQTLVKTAGLLLAPLLFAGIYLVACHLAARIDGAPAGEVVRRFVFSLVPIAIGYHLAHYFSYLIIQGQMIVPLASDPFGFGWNLFGAAGRPLDVDAIDMRLVWLVAAGGVVLGHAAAVVLAHRAATAGSMRLVSQAPLVVLMIAYTVTSLWILAQPIVAH
ncbi:hypothetical protein ACUSIJ_03885 [Pseudochelatococcus sp. B33]